MNGRDEYFLIGCAIFSEAPGFALPVFALPGNDSVNYVQEVDEISGKITNFRRLMPVQISVLAAIDAVQRCVGDEQVIAFVSRDGRPHFGTASDLRLVFQSFVSAHPENVAIRLQIAEVVGSAEEKRNMRMAMRAIIERALGPRSAKSFYEGSVLRSAVWQKLIASALTQEAAEAIIACRSRIGITITQDRTLALDLSAIRAELRDAIDADSVCKQVLLEFSIELDEGRDEVYFEETVADQAGLVREFLSAVRGTGRQEERLAILIRGIMENREIGISTLLQYRNDRAKFANASLPLIKEYLVHANESERHRELAATKLVGELYSRSFPTNRGYLMLVMAKHLAKWPSINDLIRERLNKSNSVFVSPYRESIEEMLNSRKVDPIIARNLPLFEMAGDNHDRGIRQRLK